MRILKQAEQWPSAANTTLSRGIGFDDRDMDPGLARDLHQVLNAGYSPNDPGINELAGRLLDHAAKQSGGLGSRWTTSDLVSRGFSSRSPNSVPPKRHLIKMVVSGDWNGEGLNEGETSEANSWWPREKEHYLNPGTPVQVHSVRITKPGAGWWLDLPIIPHKRMA